MKKLFILLILSSCALPKVKVSSNIPIIDFNDNLSFADFKELLIKYSKSSPYPKIDN